MSFRFFKKKLDEYKKLIESGKHSTAAFQMEKYLDEGLEEKSDVAQLMCLVTKFDTDVKQSIEMLQQGMPEDALGKIEQLRLTLKQIKIYANLVAKDEEDLE